MKVKLCVSRERYQEIKDALLDHGIEIDDHADLIISERSCFEDHLMVKNLKTNERMVLSTREIVSIESFDTLLKSIHKMKCIRRWIDCTGSRVSWTRPDF